jgi:tetratricopeptide (TPR) repeat protein
VSLAAALLLLVAVVGGVPPAAAAPRVPASDAEVLQRVRPAADPEARALRSLTERLRATPDDLPLALELARRHLVIARTTADPRHVGRAEAALAPWIDAALPPLPVLLLRAAMRQSRHDFAGALADLDAVLAAVPGNAQALLTRATIRLVQADLTGAERDCAALVPRTTPLVAVTCRAAIDGMRGQARGALAALEKALAPGASADPATVRAWALTLAGDIHARLGEHAAAAARFRAALALEPDDVAARAALADVLLAAGDPAGARAVAHDLRPDALLLRAALAARGLRAAEADALLAQLLDRMQEATLRGDSTHLREAGLVHLDLLGDARRALDLAQRNFAVQREPADALLLLRAAHAAGRPEAAAPALAWLDTTRIEDAAIQAAASALQGRP